MRRILSRNSPKPKDISQVYSHGFLHKTDLPYEQISLGTRKISQVFDAHLEDDMHLLRVDPLMCAYMYVAEAAVR
jgi:hypothetical protein